MAKQIDLYKKTNTTTVIH